MRQLRRHRAVSDVSRQWNCRATQVAGGCNFCRGRGPSIMSSDGGVLSPATPFNCPWCTDLVEMTGQFKSATDNDAAEYYRRMSYWVGLIIAAILVGVVRWLFPDVDLRRNFPVTVGLILAFGLIERLVNMYLARRAKRQEQGNILARVKGFKTHFKNEPHDPGPHPVRQFAIPFGENDRGAGVAGRMKSANPVVRPRCVLSSGREPARLARHGASTHLHRIAIRRSADGLDCLSEWCWSPSNRNVAHRSAATSGRCQCAVGRERA